MLISGYTESNSVSSSFSKPSVFILPREYSKTLERIIFLFCFVRIRLWWLFLPDTCGQQAKPEKKIFKHINGYEWTRPKFSILTYTPLQRPLYFVPANSPYIDPYLNFSTTANSLQPATLMRVPNCQNNLSKTASFFLNDWWKSQELSRIYPYGTFVINRGKHILICFI